MARVRGHGEYSAAPLRHIRGHRRPWLRTAQLNVVGWSALLGACLLTAALGIAAARATGLSSWSGAALAVAPLGAVVLLHRRRWAAMETSFGWGGSPEEVALIASELEARSVPARVDVAGTAQG